MKLGSLIPVPSGLSRMKARHDSLEPAVFTQISFHFRFAHSRHYRGLSDACTPARETRIAIALNRGDRLLSGNEEPALGAHLVTPRFAFAHHGVYVGGGKVVHYGAVAYGLRCVPVQEVSLSFFAHGRRVYARPHAAPRFDCHEVIRRARSRLGEDSYGLLRNNCEHLCEWCVQGVARSHQVERVLKFPRGLLRTVRAVFFFLGTPHPFLGRTRRALRVLPVQFSV